MKLPDPFYLKSQEPKTYIQFAASQLQGKRERQEDYFVNFNDECFIVADGVGETEHGDIAAQLAAETALWGYKLVRQRPFYWGEKKEFMSRIFRSTNLTIWQKQKDPLYSGKLASTLDVVIVNDRSYWFGHAGDSATYLFRNGSLAKLTEDHINKQGKLTKYIGEKRLGLGPQIGSGRYKPSDILLMVTDGITHALAHQTIETILRNAIRIQLAPVDTVSMLLDATAQADDSDNMTACIIRRIG